jgi:hypothetical protein
MGLHLLQAETSAPIARITHSRNESAVDAARRGIDSGRAIDLARSARDTDHDHSIYRAFIRGTARRGSFPQGQMCVTSHSRDDVGCGEFPTRQISAGPRRFLRANRAGVVFHLLAGVVYATTNCLEALLVAAPRIPLALKYSGHRAGFARRRLHPLRGIGRVGFARGPGHELAPGQHAGGNCGRYVAVQGGDRWQVSPNGEFVCSRSPQCHVRFPSRS